LNWNGFGARYKRVLVAVNDVSRKCVARATLLRRRSQRTRERNTASKSFPQRAGGDEVGEQRVALAHRDAVLGHDAANQSSSLASIPKRPFHLGCTRSA
jgi:hypothetical protein